MGAVSLSAGDDAISIEIDGIEALANLFDELARAEGARSLNEAMQLACDTFATDVLLPEVRQAIPTASGFLASQLEAFPVRRRTPGGCAGVGFPRDEAFQGDAAYAGWQEFGWQAGKAATVPPDRFLRRTLYQNEARFERHVKRHLREWVRRTNRL